MVLIAAITTVTTTATTTATVTAIELTNKRIQLTQGQSIGGSLSRVPHQSWSQPKRVF
jgi:ribosomal protein S3AE